MFSVNHDFSRYAILNILDEFIILQIFCGCAKTTHRKTLGRYKMKLVRRAFSGAILALSVALPQHSETLKAEGGSAAGLSALVPQLMSKYVANSHEVRVNVDQTLTRATLKVATGAIDIASTPAGAFAKMEVGKGPYKKLARSNCSIKKCSLTLLLLRWSCPWTTQK